MKNKVLVFAVHPDDETLGCGGTLLKHKSNGDEINWLILTSRTKLPPIAFSDHEIEKRVDTINKVAEQYSFSNVIQTGYPVIFLHTIDIHTIISKIDEVLDKIKPNIVYLMYKNDVHSDHRVAFDAAYSCTKNFRKPYIEKIYMFEAISETEFAPALQGESFIPNVYVDITDYFEKKIDIIKLYDTEIMTPPYPRSISSIEALARYRGSRAGVMYAEAFMLLYEKL